MKDLELGKQLKRGSREIKVRLIQEWLCLHGCHIKIDGDFGPATEAAVKEFQQGKGLSSDGIVRATTFQELVRPMTTALEPIEPDNKILGQMVVTYAEQHLAHCPHEIGGQNKGPWVRLYMKGNEGSEWPWCAGFVSFILAQACKSTNIRLPLQTSFSCDSLAASAKERGLFLKEKDIRSTADIAQGSLFLVKRTQTDWVHTGIIIEAKKDVIYTIEGNTNDDGDREGYEVCKRIRGYGDKDFVIIH